MANNQFPRDVINAPNGGIADSNNFSNYGMGGGGSSMASYYGDPAMFGSPIYDISGINKGAQALSKGFQYNPQSFTGFNYSTPGFSQVAPRSLVGGQRPTDKKTLADTYDLAMGSELSPIMAQAGERMRGVTQGFEGGRLTGPAMQEMILKNAQKTGSDVQDVSRGIGSQLAGRHLSQLETEEQGANEEKKQTQTEQLGERTKQRDTLFQAEIDRQSKQAQMDYLKAGFSDEQAKALANGVMSNATLLANQGNAWVNTQMGMAKNANDIFNQSMNWGPDHTKLWGTNDRGFT